jgi:hypothetical protein
LERSKADEEILMISHLIGHSEVMLISLWWSQFTRADELVEMIQYIECVYLAISVIPTANYVYQGYSFIAEIIQQF